MKIVFIKEKYMSDLETRVNNWIQDHPEYEIIDIKYSAVPWYSSPEYSVMIIYR